MKNPLLLVLAIIGFLFIACNDDDDVEREVTYTDDVSQILNASCAIPGCHVSNGNAPFPLETFEETVAAVGFGRILGAINQEAGFVAMPFPPGSPKLPETDIDKITEWIENGTPE